MEQLFHTFLNYFLSTFFSLSLLSLKYLVLPCSEDGQRDPFNTSDLWLGTYFLSLSLHTLKSDSLLHSDLFSFFFSFWTRVCVHVCECDQMRASVGLCLCKHLGLLWDGAPQIIYYYCVCVCVRACMCVCAREKSHWSGMEFNKTIRLVSNWLLVTLNKNCHSKYVCVYIFCHYW